MIYSAVFLKAIIIHHGGYKNKDNKWQEPALEARSCHLRFMPAAKLFSTFITICLVVCLKIPPAANSIFTRATIT